MSENITLQEDVSLEGFYDEVGAAAELEQELKARDAARTVLDELGVTYPDLGQQGISSYCGTGSSNGCDLDGE